MSKSLLGLLHITDAALPIGGFAHSAGLETYVQQGIVHNAATAKTFVTNMLTYNIHYTDAALVSLTFTAAKQVDFKTIVLLDEECNAVKMPKEIRQASNKLGIRLIKLIQPLYNNELINCYADAIKTNQAFGHYSIAFALAGVANKASLNNTLTAFYFNAATSMVTNAVKLIPLSQQVGQQILYSLHPLISNLTSKNIIPNKQKIGICCPGFDIKSMQHEQLYSRLYMS